jgi:hypothetical protein
LIGLAAADEDLKCPIPPLGNIFCSQGDKFGPPGEQIIPERQHGFVAKTPGAIRLYFEKSLKVIAGHAFRLFGAIVPQATHLTQR